MLRCATPLIRLWKRQRKRTRNPFVVKTVVVLITKHQNTVLDIKKETVGVLNISSVILNKAKTLCFLFDSLLVQNHQRKQLRLTAGHLNVWWMISHYSNKWIQFIWLICNIQITKKQGLRPKTRFVSEIIITFLELQDVYYTPTLKLNVLIGLKIDEVESQLKLHTTSASFSHGTRKQKLGHRNFEWIW